MSNWRKIENLPLDKDRWPIAFRALVLCDCAPPGGEIVTTGAVVNGEIICECQHNIQFTHFFYLPRPDEGAGKIIKPDFNGSQTTH